MSERQTSMTDAELAWACIHQLFEEYKLDPVHWCVGAKLERLKRECQAKREKALDDVQGRT